MVFTALHAQVIHPAEAKHIEKYSEQKQVLVLETSKMYEEVTKPHILGAGQFSVQVNKLWVFFSFFSIALQWIQNVLDGVSERERVIVRKEKPETQAFVLVRNLTFEGDEPEEIDYDCIVKDSSLRSIRDLKVEHMDLLRAVETTCFVSMN